jgi:hypothetical protein
MMLRGHFLVLRHKTVNCLSHLVGLQDAVPNSVTSLQLKVCWPEDGEPQQLNCSETLDVCDEVMV